MYISNNKKFIFIHIPKTAGESITEVLYNADKTEKNIFNIFTEKLARKSLVFSNFFPTPIKQNNQNSLGLCSSIGKHSSAQEILNVIDPYLFQKSFKFSFVRNPWDQVVSFYNHLRKPLYLPQYKGKLLNPYNACKTALECDFPTWVIEIYERRQSQDEMFRTNNPVDHFKNQHEWLYSLDGEMLVDYIGKYESLSKDLEIIGKRIGIDFSSIPIKNKSQRRNYREYYDSTTKDIIGSFFLKDIQLFNYNF